MNLMQSLRRHAYAPAFGLIVVLLTALAVAVNATTFSALYAVRWKALPYADGDRLVELKADFQKAGFRFGLADRFRDALREEHSLFDGVLGFSPNTPTRYLDDQDMPWQLARVTADFAQVLGVAPALGRPFHADDADVMLLSDAFWRTRFGGDVNIVGRTLRVGGTTRTVIGVMPRSFAFPDARTDAWTPLVWSAAERESNTQSLTGTLMVVARLANGATPAQVREKLDALLANDAMLAAHKKDDPPKAVVAPLRDRQAGSLGMLRWLELAALVLLGAVALSLANLMLDRLLAQARGHAIRRALGARDTAIARAVAADVALPLATGLAFGLLIAPFGLRLLQVRGMLPPSLPQGAGFGFAAIAAGVVTTAVMMVAALAAAWPRQQVATNAPRAMHDLGRLRAALLVAQVALATVMIGNVALLARSAVNLFGEDRGFDERGVLFTSFDPFDRDGAHQRGETPQENPDTALTARLQALREDIDALPDVRAAGFAAMPPFSGSDSTGEFAVPQFAQRQLGRDRQVSAGYFAAMGMPLLAGDDFRDGDRNGVIVDERFVARYLGGGDAIGARIDFPDDQGNLRPSRITGVVHSTKNRSLDEDDGALPMIYRPLEPQWPWFWLVTRAESSDAWSVASTLRERILARFPQARVDLQAALADRIVDSLGERRHLLETIGGVAMIALTLAALSLAAVLGFAIRRRTAELGVRLAVGATPSRVRNLVLRQGGTLVVTGLVFGAALGIALARLLADKLFGVGFADPASWCAALTLVAAIALLACWLPARRAAATDPIEALRHE